jgi:acetyl esterase/lipase
MKGILIAALLFSLRGFSQDTVKKAIPLPQGFTKSIDVAYKQVGDWQGRVDIYLPPKTNKPAPVLINMHGGAWRHGAKEDQSGFATYFKLGFAVANVEYRLSQQGLAPAGIEDVRCSMLYLINHSDSLNIDVNKIVFCGNSAGAHLALLAALADNVNDHLFDKDCPRANKPYHVAAVIAQSTPSVLFETTAAGEKVLKDGAIYEWFGPRKDDVTFAKQLSPVTYIDKNDPPVFLTHGNADKRVPYQQSVDLDAKLTAAGVKHVFITIDGGGHGGYPKEKQNEIKEAIAAFLKENVIK